jgi:WD40 repeat protein
VAHTSEYSFRRSGQHFLFAFLPLMLTNSPLVAVSFSPEGLHIASASGGSTIHVWDTETGQVVGGPFTDQSWIDIGGWICGKDGGLLLWIPALHCAFLHGPSTVWGIDRRKIETRLDLSNFVHGSNWATVYDHTLSR